MAASKYNADTLLAGIKTRIILPDAYDRTYSDANIYRLADAEVISYIVPKIKKVREKYFVSPTYVPLVSDKQKYRIPYRSIGGAVNEVKLYNSQSKVFFDLPIYSSDEINSKDQSQPLGMVLEGPYLKLTRSPKSNMIESYDQLYIEMFVRPGILVPTNQAARVLSVSGNIVTVTGLPVAFSTAMEFDLIKDGGINDILEFDKAGTVSVNNSQITFPSTVPSELEINDWISLPGETPVANIPVDFYPLLEQRTAVKILEGLGDPNLQIAQQKAVEIEGMVMATIIPRVTEEEPIITQTIFRGWS